MRERENIIPVIKEQKCPVWLVVECNSELCGGNKKPVKLIGNESRLSYSWVVFKNSRPLRRAI